jgi:hypothetical protein
MRRNPPQRRSSVPGTRRRHSSRLLVERLENRLVPTTLFTNLNGHTFSHAAFFTGSAARLMGAPQDPGSGSSTSPASQPLTATTTTVVASANPAGPGQTVTFTATVASTGGGTPTGTVQFQIDGMTFGDPVTISDAGGAATATLSTSSLATGIHSVTADYSGDSNFAASIGILTGGETVAVSNVFATLVASAGLLRITGYNDSVVITIQQNAAGVLQVAGVGTLVNESSDPANFPLSSIREIDVTLLNGNDTVSMANVSIPGTISIFAGSGSDGIFLGPVTANLISVWVAGPGQDVVSLHDATAGAVNITAGDNASLLLSGVSAGTVMLTAGNNATVSVSNLTAPGDLDISVGDNAQSVAVKGSTSDNLNILQTGTKGSPLFDLENDTIQNELDLNAGDGNNTLVLSNLNVAVELLVRLGGGENTVSADHVAALFGSLDGGPSGKNTYTDGGGNSGLLVFHFVGH